MGQMIVADTGESLQGIMATDHTTILVAWYDGQNVKSEMEVVRYADYARPEHLPDAARCLQTKAEWCAWHRANNTKAWKKYQREQASHE